MNELLGLILAGGQSSRMGRDKSTLNYHGTSQRQFLAHTLGRHCKRVFTSVKNQAEAVDEIADRFDIDSPINGIISAMTLHPNNAWLVVAVDMPNISQRVVELLIQRRSADRVATCFFNNIEQKPEPLLTIWEAQSLPLLVKFVDGGRISPRDFLSEHDVELITPDDPDILLNVNTPEELKRFLERTTRGKEKQ